MNHSSPRPNSPAFRFQISKPATPDRAVKIARPAWLFLPAYLALAIALGGMCRALSHFITTPEVSTYLWGCLIVNSAVSFGLCCGSPIVAHWAKWIRLFALALLPLAVIAFNANILAPLDAESEVNATVALLVGWVALICVLFTGMRYGEKRVPLTAPLVPGLSLFGLLNSLSVDTIVQISFLVFVGASLYLVVYERMLHRVLTKKSPEVDLAEINISPLDRSAQLSRQTIGRTALSYLVACGLWFAAFLGGAAVFFYPVQAILPRVLATPLSAVRGASATLLDWRTSSHIVELRGGNYPLSDREILRIELLPPSGGTPTIPALWRGRVYENYSDSRWSATEYPSSRALRIDNNELTPIQPALAAADSPQAEQGYFESPPLLVRRDNDFRHLFAPVNERLVRRHQIEALVNPVQYRSSSLFFPGELTALATSAIRVQASPDGTYRTMGGFFRSLPYVFQAEIKEERLSGLAQAPGLSPQQLQQWKSDEYSAPTLALEPELREQLAPIARQILSASQNPATPFARANAIHQHLRSTCTYSLSSPLVPSTEDGVLFFLKNSKRGACDMFASAMVLLLRSMDVPARLATGFIEPEEITNGQTTSSGSTLARSRWNLSDSTWRGGESAATQTPFPSSAPKTDKADAPRKVISFTIREREAHAWVEYYVPGAGWLIYDPTAGTRTTQLPIEAQIATMLNLPSFHMNWKVLWMPLAGAALILTGVLWTLWDAQKKRAVIAQNPAEQERAQIAAVYQQAIKVLTSYVPYKPQQTPLEYEAAVNRADIAPPAKQEFTALTYLLMSARYKRELPAMSQTELQSCLSRLKRALR